MPVSSQGELFSAFDAKAKKVSGMPLHVTWKRALTAFVTFYQISSRRV